MFHAVVHAVVVDWFVLKALSVNRSVSLDVEVACDVLHVVVVFLDVAREVFCALPVLQKSILVNPIFFMLSF